MNTVEVKQVIITTLSRAGDGTEDNPVRVITEIWDMNGTLLYRIDPYLTELLLKQEQEINALLQRPNDLPIAYSTKK